jgi:hypothetical protein
MCGDDCTCVLFIFSAKGTADLFLFSFFHADLQLHACLKAFGRLQFPKLADELSGDDFKSA